MDTASVERAFLTTPSVKGKFSWSQSGDEMTFTPDGFPPRSLVLVRISDTAHGAVSGKNFYAGFESRYFCGGAAAAP